MSLKNIIGQNDVVKVLLNEINTQSVKHAYIFYGVRGVGKKFTAVQFAKSLLCPDVKDGYSCDECETCKSIDDNTHPDVTIVDFDFQQQILSQKEKTSSISIDTIRYVKHLSMLTPYSSKYKIFIIDSAETLHKEAANSLLKLLEEPVAYRVFILITTSLGLLPKTVISRCEQLRFLPLNRNNIRKLLNINQDSALYDTCVLGSVNEFNYIQEIKELNFDISTMSVSTIQELSSKIAEDKEFAKYFIVWVTENVVLKHYNVDNTVEWYDFINEVESYIKQMKYNIDIQLLIETLLLRLKNLCSKNIFLT